MVLVAMNWKKDKPPKDFVGFALESQRAERRQIFRAEEPAGFPGHGWKCQSQSAFDASVSHSEISLGAFPRNGEIEGDFTYKVTPVFMNAKDELSYGESQQAGIELRRETFPGKLNVTFTRGFVSSQAFVDKFGADAIPKLLPATADGGLDFVPGLPKAEDALAGMGFEARSAILEVLDQAIADKNAQVRLVVYDFNLPELLSRLKKAQGPAEDDHRRFSVVHDRSRSIFDHYEFRVAQTNAKQARKKLQLKKPPQPGEKTWFEEDYVNARKIRDRELFS